MLGIDITRISRFKDAKDTFVEKILHPNEIVEYAKTINKEKFLAARWAIKEALYKADNSLLHFNQIEIVKCDGVYQFPGYKITTSNEDDLYIAFVAKER